MLFRYWDDNPPVHEMLALIATSPYIGWKRPHNNTAVPDPSALEGIGFAASKRPKRPFNVVPINLKSAPVFNRPFTANG